VLKNGAIEDVSVTCRCSLESQVSLFAGYIQTVAIVSRTYSLCFHIRFWSLLYHVPAVKWKRCMYSLLFLRIFR